ncbi:MAG: DUF5018 domain-containing protein [Paludibacteraceae bacterium]|nr:DUF5018 domain-containing protein [Paludibacteraceae bacterium]
MKKRLLLFQTLKANGTNGSHLMIFVKGVKAFLLYMKKRLLIALLLAFLLTDSASVWAQTTVTWALSSALTPSSTSGTGYTSTNANVQTSPFAVKDYTGKNSAGAAGALRVTGTSSGATYMPTAFSTSNYVEFKVTAASGYDLNVSAINTYLGYGSSPCSAAIYYSLDGFSTTNYALVASASPLSVQTNGSSPYLTTCSYTSTNFNGGTNITVPSGSTLSFRVYPWCSSGSSGKYFIISNSSITFTAATSCTAPTATTGAASGTTATTATLNGTINANSLSTAVTFNYGLTTSYGSNVTAAESPVTGSSATAVTAALTGLTANTTYHYRVSGTSSCNTTNGTDASFVTLPAAPTASAGTSACSGFTANWAAPSGGSAYTPTYTLQYGTDNTFATNTQVTGISSISQAVTGLAAGTPYYYRVKAVTTAGSSDWSGTITVTTLATPSITTQPTGTTYTQGATASALSVGASGAGVSYQWYSNTSQSTTGATTLTGQTSSTYTPSTSAIGTIWYYCVVSGTCTPSVTSNIVSVVVSGGTTPTIVLTSGTASQTVSAGSAVGSIVYTWGGSATSATVTWTGSSSSTPTGMSVNNNSGSGPVTISGTPTVAGTYNYSITSTDGTNTSSALTGTITVKLATPTVGTASSITGTGFTANWTGVSNATSYTVKVYQGASVVATQTGATGTSVAITGLTAGTTYTYTVTAVGAVNSDESSASASFTTLSSVCNITAFSIASQTSSNISGTAISVVMPYGTSLTSLIPTITLSAGATVSPTSGTSHDFTSPVTYTVTAADGTTTQNYTVTVTNAAGSSSKDITAFAFTNATATSTTINSTTSPYTVTIVMPALTDRYTLIPSITISANATINPASGVNQDFRSPVTYTVTAQDGSTKTYTVTVTNQAATCSYTLSVPSATYVTGGTPSYYYEVSGVGYLMKNATGSSSWSLTTGLSTCQGNTSGLTTSGSLFAFKTYNAISSFKIYGLGSGGSNRAFSSMQVGTTTSNYSSASASASGGDAMFTTSGTCDSMIITPASTIAANSYVQVALSGNVSIVKIVFNGTCVGITPLTAPTVGSPSTATNQGFTANWSDVSNELGYRVVVYNTTGDSITSVTTAANATSVAITGLSSNTSYYYKVRALGDGDVYSTSVLSSASTTIRTLSTAKDITVFTIAGVSATISGTSITATVLHSTNVTSLSPTITSSDYATVSPTSGTAEDFTSPVNYTVTAEDGSTQVYTVTITKAAVSTACDITAFSVSGQISSTISGTNISVTMPYGTDLTSLTPSVTVSGGATYIPSGLQNFSSSVTYTITAEDGSTTKQYTVSVIIATPSISVCTSGTISFTSAGYNPTASQSCAISGSNLSTDIAVTADAPFQVSTDNANWATTATITKSGSVASGTIYVRYYPTSGISHSGTAIFTSTGATTQSFSLAGTVATGVNDYFQSVATGDWSVATNWQSSPDGLTWIAATTAPTSSAKSVSILSGHNITISTATAIGKTNVKAGGTLTCSAIYTVAASDTLTIEQNGTLEYTASANASASNSPVITGAIVVNGNYIVNPTTPANLNTTAPSDKLYYIPTTNATYATTSVVTIKRLPASGDNLRITKDLPGTLIFDVQSASDNAGTAGYNFLSYTPCTIGTLIIKGTGAGSISQGTGSTARALTVSNGMTISGGTYAVAGGTSTAASTLTVIGDVTLSGGTLTSSNSSAANTSSTTIKGNVTITGGTFTNYTGTGTGARMFLAGTTAQTISATGTYTVGSFTVNNSNGVTLNSNLTVGGTLTLTAGNLTIGGYNLTVSNAIAGTPSASSHIVTNGAGVVQYATASGSYVFPVGADATHYTPVTITNTGGTSQTYTVNVVPISTPSLTNALNYKWNIGGITGSASTLAFTWDAGSANGTLATDPTNGIAYNYNTGWTAVGGSTSSYVTTVTSVTSSNPLAWTVCHKNPVVTTQPTDNQSECIGGTTTLGTLASDQVVTYQWYTNTTKSNTGGTIVAAGTGGTTTTYTPDASIAGTYYYYCVVSNGYGSTASTAVQITVNAAPIITGASNVSRGSTTTLSADITGGTWTSGTPAVATIDSSTGLLTGVSGGSTIITYTTATGCSSTKTIAVVDSVYKSVASADWSAVSTWNLSLDGGATWAAATVLPSLSDRKVIISAGNTVSISSGSVAVKTLYITSTGKIYNQGTFTANDSIIFVADNASTAQFKNDGTVNNNGVVKLLKYFTAGVWYNVGFPFDIAHGQVNDVVGHALTPQSDFYVDLYDGNNRAYNNAANSTNGLNWVAVTPENLTANRGYIMGRSKSTNSYGVNLYYQAVNSVAGTASNDLFSNGSKTVNVDLNYYSGTTTVSNQGWNLVANPYSTAYNLRYLSPAVICYVFDPLTNSYQTVSNEDFYLDPFKSFFIQTASPTLTFTGGTTSLRSATTSSYDEAKLTFSNGTYSDNVRVRLSNDATTGYELNVDGVKFLSASVPQVYSTMNGYNLSINALPLNQAGSDITVPISYYAKTAGSYTFNYVPTENSANITKLYLSDNGTLTDLLSNPTYTVSLDAGTNTTRFALVINTIENGTTTGVKTSDASDKITVSVSGNKITFTGFDSKAKISLYDVTGKLVTSYSYDDVNNLEPIVVNGTGVYVITANTATQTFTKKIIIAGSK